MIKLSNGGITSPKGFLANGIYCGIKKKKSQSERVKDLAIIFSERNAFCAAVFTQNKVTAAPVKYCKDILRGGRNIQAVVANSGNANCCTGKYGLRDARLTADYTSRQLDVASSKVLVASTGIIGRFLPIDNILGALPSLVEGLSVEGAADFARAILTTDTISKEIAVTFKIGRSNVTLAGAAKGAGMIYPHMATMLCFLTTDINIKPGLLKKALSSAVDKSFNRISVDGDMSTNDSCFIMANGMAGNDIISKEGADFARFSEALDFVALHLAKLMVKDGEGATKFVRVMVKNAKTLNDAKKAARAVCNSNLVKTALFGSDPNFGRIAASVGASGAYVKENRLDIYLGNTKSLGGGCTSNLSYKKLKDIFKKKEVCLTIDLKCGRHSFDMLTCDLSYDYVRLNI